MSFTSSLSDALWRRPRLTLTLMLTLMLLLLARGQLWTRNAVERIVDAEKGRAEKAEAELAFYRNAWHATMQADGDLAQKVVSELTPQMQAVGEYLRSLDELAKGAKP